MVCPCDFPPLGLWVPAHKQRWQIRKNAAGTGTLNANCRVMFAQRPQQHYQGTKKASANRAVLTLWPLTNLFWHMGVLGLKNLNERKVFYHFSVIAGWTCPYMQPLPWMHFWKGVSDKHQNAPLVMSSGRGLCSHWTMAEASSGSTAAQGWGQQRAAGAERWKLGLGPAGVPTLHSPLSSSFCFLFLQTGRVQEMTGLPSCRTQQHKENHHYLLRSLPG